jgi:two-component system phosphate regulon sensor histidine kinase PhoR
MDQAAHKTAEVAMDQDSNFHDRSSMDRPLMASFIEALPHGVLVITKADIRVLAANAPAREIFPALRLDDPLARSVRSPDILDAIGRARISGRAERITWLERLPVERLFEIAVAPVEHPESEPVFVLTFHDLTEARRVERMRVDFVANASHELRTPLSSLLGFVETLQGPARADAQAREKFLGIMREQAQRMARLVDDLLSLSRIEQNLHVRPDAVVDLVSLLRHIADTLTPMAKENNLTLKVEAPPSVLLRGDRDELLRVAENLIENAIKYGAPEDARGPSSVEIIVTPNETHAVLAVRDHGPGIPTEHLPRLTERFYRVDAGKSRAKGGTGLGLAIVKHIVARHRGRLTIESEPSLGSTFTVTLPLFG